MALPSLRDLLGRRRTAATNALVRVGFGRSWSSSDWGYTRTLNGVLANPTAYRCVETVVNNMARPPWQVRRPGSDEGTPHELLGVLNQPGPTMSGTAAQRFMAQDLELAGKSVWMRVQGRDGFGDTGPLTGLRRLPIDRVTVFGNDDDEVIGFVYRTRSGALHPFLPEGVVYLRYPHPARAYDGLAPALLAGLGAETDTASARFNYDLLANDGALPGYITVEGLTPEQFREWKAEWEAGESPGRTRFMSGNADYFKVGQTNQELTYDELRRSSQGDVYKAFGVARVLVEPEDATFANARQAKALFWQQRVLPALTLEADDMTMQVGADAGVDVGFDLSLIEELNEGMDDLVERSIKLLDRKAITVNEVRERLRLAPVGRPAPGAPAGHRPPRARAHGLPAPEGPRLRTGATGRPGNRRRRGATPAALLRGPGSRHRRASAGPGGQGHRQGHRPGPVVGRGPLGARPAPGHHQGPRREQEHRGGPHHAHRGGGGRGAVGGGHRRAGRVVLRRRRACRKGARSGRKPQVSGSQD